MSLQRDNEIALKSIGRFHGKYPAVVTDNNDPDKMYRVKVRCAAIFPTEIFEAPVISDWCLPSLPPGFFYVPAIGDEIWIEFQQGHPDYPIWISKFIAPDGPQLLGSPTLGALAGAGSNFVASAAGDQIGDYYPFVHVIQSPQAIHRLSFSDFTGDKWARLRSELCHLDLSDDNGPEVSLGTDHEGDAGYHLLLSDLQGKSELSTPGGYKVTLDESGSTLQILDPSGSSTTFDSTGIHDVSSSDYSAEDSLGAKLNLSGGLAALGNSSGELFDQIDQFLGKASDLALEASTHTHPTAVGPSGPPTTAANFITLSTDLLAIKAIIGLIKGSL